MRLRDVEEQHEQKKMLYSKEENKKSTHAHMHCRIL